MVLVKERHLAGRHFNRAAAQKPWDMVTLVETAQCNSFSLLFTELARAQVHAHMVRKSPTETKFLLTLRASLGHFIFFLKITNSFFSLHISGLN